MPSTELYPDNPEGLPQIPLSSTGYRLPYTSSSTPLLLFPRLSPQDLHGTQRSTNKRSKDGNGEGSPIDGDGENGHSTGIEDPFKNRRTRSSKGLDKKFKCPQEGCGKHCASAEHLYRHQLNHTPKQIYNCDFPDCERTFIRQDLYKKHRDRHTAKGSQLYRRDSMPSHAYAHAHALPATEAGKPENVQSTQTPFVAGDETYGGLLATGSTLPLTLSQVGINNQQLPPTAIEPQVYGTEEGFDRICQTAPTDKLPIVTATPWKPCGTCIQGHGLDEIRQIISQNLPWDTTPDFSNSQTRKRKRAEPSLYVSFNVHWQLEKFVGEQYGETKGTSLASIITLTGSAVCAQATTVGEYLQRNWPKTCSILLPLLAKAQNGDTPVEYRDLGVQVTVTHYGRERATFSVLGQEELLVEIAQQLAWLGSAFCTSVTSQIGRSQARILSQSQGSQGSTFDIIFKVDDLPDGETSCWHYLFEDRVIAYNFPIPCRGHEVGLEIPLDMMAALGGACRAVDFEGGLVLKGFSSMFVPLRRTGNSIQWHFIYNKDESRLSYQDVDMRCPGRALLDTVDQKSLKQTRAFLGWWGSTATQLGAKDANYENITWSDTKEPSRSVNFSGGSLGFQNFGTGELNFSIGHNDSKLHISRNGPYQRIIKYASKTPVVLYDPGEADRRAWLVPASGVIAHIAQTKHFRERFSINGVLTEIKPTESTLGIYEAAEKMLLQNSATVLGHDDLGKPNFYFRDLVLNIWSLLEVMIDKGLKNDASADPAIHATMRTSLRGWEFMDVVDERCPMRMKETYLRKSCGGWADFICDISAVVLFASGFEDIIKPAEDETRGLCHMWKGVPKEKDYLTASVAVLNILFEQAGSILTRKHLTSTHLQWHRGPILFESCPTSDAFRCDCDRVQMIVKKSQTTFGTVVPPGPLKQQGAVIFGQARHPFKQLRLSEPQTKTTQLYSQENGPLVMESEILHSLHSSASTEYESPSFDCLDFGKTIATSDYEVHPDILDHKTKLSWEDQPHYQAQPQVRKRARDDSEYTCQVEMDNRRPHRQRWCGKQSHQTSCNCTLVEINRRILSPDYRPLEPVHEVRQNHLRKLQRKPAVHFPGRDLGDGKLRSVTDADRETELTVLLQEKV